MERDGKKGRKPEPHEVDQYPTLKEALTRLAKCVGDENTRVERISINFGAQGDASYRYWEPRAEEATAGFASNADLG